MIWAIAMFCTTVVVIWYRSKALIIASYYQGYRACVKDAVVVLKDIESQCMQNAPIGELTAGVVRAEIVHECEMKVRELSRRIGREL
jgi:hypothetical protein